MAIIDNQTPYAVELVVTTDKDGRTVGVAIAKGTYQFDGAGNLALADEQVPVAFADEPIGEAGKSDPRIPSDFVDYKPAADVLLVRPKGDLSQSPFWGRTASVELGPVRFSGRIGDPWPFGPLRPDRKPRSRYAGTYGQDWVDNRMPLLPLDFDPRFHQVAPPRQVAPGYLNGDEHLKITNLYPQGTVEADLPGRVVVVAGNVLSHYFARPAVLDTILIWPEQPRVTLVWRHAIRCRQKFEEICNVFFYLCRLRTARELFGVP